MNPTQFMLWAFLATITMMFAGFTSALVVSRSDSMSHNMWFGLSIPTAFYYSTALIVFSSITMQWAYWAAKRNILIQNRIALWVTIFAGIGFIISQIAGYLSFIHENVFVSGNNIAGSYFYVISLVHAMHVLGGIVFVIFTLFSSYSYKVHSKNMFRITQCSTYWHFIGALWVYLFILLNLLS